MTIVINQVVHVLTVPTSAVHTTASGSTVQVLVNGTPLDPQIVQRYAGRGSEPVLFDRASVVRAGVIPLEADLLKEGAQIRHDGRKLARRLNRIARCGP